MNKTGYIDHRLGQFKRVMAHSSKIPLDPTCSSQSYFHHRIESVPINHWVARHLTVFSHLDIANAVSQLFQFLQDPTETHVKSRLTYPLLSQRQPPFLDYLWWS